MLPYFCHCLYEPSVQFPCSGWLEHHSQAKATPAVPLQPVAHLTLPFPLQLRTAPRIAALARTAECSQPRQAAPHCQCWEASQHIWPCYLGPEISRGRGWEPVWASTCLCAFCQPSPAYSFPFPPCCSWICAHGMRLFEFSLVPLNHPLYCLFNYFIFVYFLLKVVEGQRT